MKFNTTNVLIGAVVIAAVFYYLKPTAEGFSFLNPMRPSVDINIPTAPKTQEQIDKEKAAKNMFTFGEKIGIWIGIIIGGALLVGVGYYFYKRNYRNA